MKKNTGIGIAIAAVAVLGCAAAVGAAVKHIVSKLDKECDFDCEHCECCDCQPKFDCENDEKSTPAVETETEAEKPVEEIEKIVEPTESAESTEIKIEE